MKETLLDVHMSGQSIKAFKVVVVGDGAIGKTCLLMCFTQSMFPREYIPTVFDNYSKNIDYQGQHIRLDLYDTAGQEDYDRLRVISYPNTDVFLVCYAIDNATSLKNIREKWVPELHTHAPDSKLILVGLKADLEEKETKERLIKEEQKKFVKKDTILDTVADIKALDHVKCSALKMTGIEDVFNKAIAVALGPGDDNNTCCCTVL